jgi:hypothetical protein
MLSTALRIRRTMTGEEVDEVIASTLAIWAQAEERARRADCRKRELSAKSFQMECDHVHDASMQHLAPDRAR